MANLSGDRGAPILPPSQPTQGGRVRWRRKIGWRIHQAREAARGVVDGIPQLTRAALGGPLGYGERTIWEIENAISSPTVDDLALLGESLNVHPGSFFDEGVFHLWGTPVNGRLPYAGIAKAIAELGEDERDIVVQLVMCLSGRQTRRPNLWAVSV